MKFANRPTAKFHPFKVNYIAVRYKRIHSHYNNGYIVRINLYERLFIAMVRDMEFKFMYCVK